MKKVEQELRDAEMIGPLKGFGELSDTKDGHEFNLMKKEGIILKDPESSFVGEKVEELVKESNFNVDSFRDTLNEASEHFRNLYGETRNTLHAQLSKDISYLVMKLWQA